MWGCFAYATTALGGAPLSGDIEFELTINGSDRSGVDEKSGCMSLRIEDTIAGRSTCELALYDEDNTYFPEVGQHLLVRAHGAKKFAGSIEDVKRNLADPGNQAVIEVRGVDFNQLADRFHVNTHYEQKTVREIVEDIVNVQTPLALEGVSVGRIDPGPKIFRAVFNRSVVNRAFRDISEASGLAWNIDYNKVLHFFDRSTYDAPFDLEDSDPHWEEPLHVEGTRDRYRNKQILIAGKERTERQIEHLRGDSSSTSPDKRRRTFSLSFEVAPGPILDPADGKSYWYNNQGQKSQVRTKEFRHPLIIRRNGAVQRVGIKGKDKDGNLLKPTPETWAQWFYEIERREITQNSAKNETLNPTLTESDILEVEYTGLFPIAIEVEDDTAIQERKAVEGGTGIYEQVETDENLDGADFAAEKAARLLLLYGRIPKTITYSTTRDGLAAGHLQNVDLSGHNISNVEYLLDQVSHTMIKESGQVVWRAQVTALDGEHTEGWADFYRRLAQAKQRRTIHENEKLLLSRQFREKVTLSDAWSDSVNGAVALDAYTADPYSWWRFGLVTVAGTGREVYSPKVGYRLGRPHGA